MAEKTLELKIEKLAGLGDGVAVHGGRKIFVPYTAAGDVIRARVTKETADATYGSIEQFITPGEGRIPPVCRHFGECGSCSLQHIDPFLYANFKQDMAYEAVRKAGFDTAVVEKLVIFAANTRRRADLKVLNGKMGFYASNSHRIVDMEECKVLEPALSELVMQVKKQLPALPHITSLQINGVDNGYDVVVEGSGAEKLQADDIRRLSIREQGSVKTLYQSGEINITLGGVAVEPPAGAFLQACKEAQELMTKRVTDATQNAHHILDLFAGIGTYTFPMARYAKVTAMEGNKPMTTAIQNAASKNNLSHVIKAQTRDLFSNPVKAAELKDYDALIINPPRAGAKAQTEEIAWANIATIVMVSCNPATFARDARILREGGYRLKRLVPVDQFVYSPHLELVAELIR